jgi:outer membrane protein
MKRILLLCIALSTTMWLHGQTILDRYVEEALQKNIAVQQHKLLEQKQAFRLQEANKGFGPELGFITSYTVAAGGRSIDFPIGTLLNDVYSTLNTLTNTNNFGQLENQTVQFLPHNYYDARFRITQPILQPEIKVNKLIKQKEVTLAKLITTHTSRDLERDVRSAYFQWLQAGEAIRIIDQGLTLLNENKRITESLIKNGAGIPSSLVRIESEITRVDAQKQKAHADQRNAAAYFNFLLNREDTAPIEADSFPDAPPLPVDVAIDGREELQQIRTGQTIESLALKLEKQHFAPRLGLQVDIGSQAYVPDWGGYALGGVQLEIPIWDNRKSNLRQQAAQSSIAATQAQYDYTRQALALELQNEINSLEADLIMYNSYTASLKSDQRFYNETLRRYKEGLSSYIELLDARTQVTNTALQQSIAKFQSWIRHARIERMSAASN